MEWSLPLGGQTRRLAKLFAFNYSELSAYNVKSGEGCVAFHYSIPIRKATKYRRPTTKLNLFEQWHLVVHNTS